MFPKLEKTVENEKLMIGMACSFSSTLTLLSCFPCYFDSLSLFSICHSTTHKRKRIRLALYVFISCYTVYSMSFHFLWATSICLGNGNINC